MVEWMVALTAACLEVMRVVSLVGKSVVWTVVVMVQQRVDPMAARTASLLVERMAD